MESGLTEAMDDWQTLCRLLAGASPSPDVDWDKVVSLARRHGVSPLLFWRLEKEEGERGRGEERRGQGVAEISDEARDSLRQDFYVAAARSVVAERQLAEVLAGLTGAGVPALVVKGAAVGAFYPDPALRTYSDLDVLVPREQLPLAEGALNSLGYRCTTPAEWSLDHHAHLPPMVAGDAGLLIEVHWRLDHQETGQYLPVQDLWLRAVPWSIEGQPALRLEDVDAALHLCRHAVVQHRARLGLRSLCDLAQVAKDWRGREWDELVQRALAYGLARPVYLMLAGAGQVLGLALPPEVLEALRPAEPLPGDLIDRLFRLDGSASVRVPVAVVQASAKGTFAARLRHILWHLFLPRDGMAAVYRVPANSPRIWLTYLWRPFDLLRRYGQATWGALRAEPAARAAWERDVWLERWLTGGEQGSGGEGG